MPLPGRAPRAALWWALVGLLWAQGAWASKSYRFSGVVTEASAWSITVSNGTDRIEVDCRRMPKLPEIGDEITVRYELDATRIEPRRPPEQQPGRTPPPKRRGRGAPGEKMYEILDDRAFYDA